MYMYSIFLITIINIAMFITLSIFIQEIYIFLLLRTDTKNYAILIYMICAGFIILVLCAVAAFYKYQKNVKKVPKGTIKYGETDSDIPSIPSRSMQPNVLIELHDNESVYELIDDENLLNL